MSNDSDKIAVIGMECRFPGADNLTEFWNNLIEGRDTVKHFTDDELAKYEYDFEALKLNPDYVRARGILNDIEKFDADFFGYTPKEAEGLDPQYRVWLETVWQALENSGCDPFKYKGKIGVFAGGANNTYLLNNILRDQRTLENYIRLRSAESFQTMIGNEISGLPTKTAYKLNLRGPAINVQTACSTSLVAVSMACQSLLIMESDICLAGGVSIMVPQETGYVSQEGGISSPDGYCRPFDNNASGTVFSNGVGVVVLKRLDDAIRDKDIILSVVIGWSMNNDGNNKVSYVAPSINGQAEVIQMSQSFAGVSPEDIGYIEAHGTATRLGDPVELTALLNAFSKKTSKKQFCGMGSVKSNIGHTDVAAGIAGFIKASLSVYNKIIPPTIHYSEPNPHFNFDDSPFYVQDKLKKWDSNKPLIIGISSFGIGGTNAHVIIEEPPSLKVSGDYTSEWPELVLLSAGSPYSLDRRKSDLVEHIRHNPDVKLSEIAYTLATGRSSMRYRSYVVARNASDITGDKVNFIDGKSDEFISRITFMYPGQGAQYHSMGRSLYDSNKLFRQILDECFEIVTSETGEDIKKILFQSNDLSACEERLAKTDLAQPALFIIEYALSKVFIQLGIKPDYLIGHSIGEYTAACIAGVFNLEDALKIVIKRGILMKSMPSGEMLSVQTSKSNVENIQSNLFEIAAENSDASCTISIKSGQSKTVIDLLDEHRINYIPLKVSHAFHSSDFDPILKEFGNYVNEFRLCSPNIPFISCLTGEFITDEQATTGEYWAMQLRNTVLFRKGINTICESGDVAFLEIGPNTHLSSLVMQNCKVENKRAIISTLGKPDKLNEDYKIIRAVGNLFNIGFGINLDSFYTGNMPGKVQIPPYKFDKKRCWIDFSLNELIINNSTSKQYIDKSELSENKETENSDKTLRQGETILDTLLRIWKTMFGIDNITAHDNFFDIGGHSLLALQIITRIKEELHQNISLKTFLENQTIIGLCSIIERTSVSDANENKFEHQTDLSSLPLSDNQKRLWIVSRLDSLNPAYNIVFTYYLDGKLDIDLFRKAINNLFGRHHALFSTFHQDGDELPYCTIVENAVNIEFIDFSNEPGESRQSKIQSFIGADSRRAFDLEKGPLFRLYLIKKAERSHYFHATFNHMVFDGWSWGVFIRDFNEIYNALNFAREISLPQLPVQFYDYARWQVTESGNAGDPKLVKFWTEYLADVPQVLNFPFDKPRKAIPSGFGGKEYIKVSESVTAHLKEISKSENTTLFTTLLSAIGTLLHKYTGDNDLCIGTPVSYRPDSRLEDIVGMFINTLAIRVKIEPEKSFRNLVGSVKISAIDAISNQELPFEKVIEVMKPERSSNMNPLFQACFAWQNNLSLPLNIEGLRGERITINEGVAPFDLTFYMWENGDFIEGEIEYNTDILEQDTIIRLKQNFLKLIENFILKPDNLIKTIPLITEAESGKISGFTGIRAEYPKDSTIVQLFKDQVVLFENRQAIVFKSESLTYKQLNDKTNQLGRTLRRLGVTRNTPVGVLTEKSLDMIVGILGILKAGGAYVPIDPEYPDKRIDFMLNDSGCKLLVVQDKFLNKNTGNVKKISLGSADMYDKNTSDLENINTSTDLAYIMYTSGTTGIPKGSLIEQKGVVRLVRNTNYLNLTSDDKILLTGAIVFDATTFEIWGALLNGGTLYIVERETILDPKALGEELDKNNITVLWLTSALFTQIAEMRTDIFRKLKYLLTGGDVLSPSHVNKVRRDNPDLKVINGYGPTENTTFSTTYLVEKNFDSNIPIGKPITNSTAYIFDRYMNYQPIGIMGELYVGGDGLSKGYINREELNRQSFIEHPYIPGERIYKTGDYASWLPDGNIEFHGRIDNQLKIRGFRVELGEIESAISEIEGIIEVVIKPLKISAGDMRLAAFLNVSDTFSIDTKELSTKLKEKLPPFMIPSAFKIMHGFPKTINGKIDRDALVLEISEIAEKNIQHLKTLTETEKKILEIWSDVLKTKDILTTDNFFEIGGNSLLSISVMSKIESVFNIELGLRVFFDSPRIKDLAEAVDISSIKHSKSKSDSIPLDAKSPMVAGEI